jgi:uncharacterized membrane protein YdbT with pleckstrin-like domain
VPFPKKLLHETEELVLDLRPHWWFLAGPVVVLLLALVLLGYTLTTDTDWSKLGAAAIAVVALGWFLLRYAKWTTTNLALTSDRLIYRSGVVAKTGIEIPLERINTVFSNQSMFERILRAGDLVVESGGERGRQSFTDIPKPLSVQNEIYRQMEANNARMYQGRGSTTLTVVEQLEKLEDLRQRGVIDDAEFQAQKQKLLSSS